MIFLVGNQVQGPKETRMLQPFTRYLLKEVGTPAASQNIGLQLANRQWGLKKETSELLLLLLVIQDNYDWEDSGSRQVWSRKSNEFQNWLLIDTDFWLSLWDAQRKIGGHNQICTYSAICRAAISTLLFRLLFWESTVSAL